MEVPGLVLWLLTLAALAVAATAFILQRKKLRHAEATLQIERQRHVNASRVLDNCDDITWLYDLDSEHLIYVSAAVERKRGWKADELIGNSSLDTLFPVGTEKISALLKQLQERHAEGQTGLAAARIEIDVPLKQGGTLPVETECKLLNGDNGRPTLLLGIHRDISERRHLEQGLREAEERVRLALHYSGDSVWDFNLLTGTLSYLDGWENLLGYDQSEAGTTLEAYKRLIHVDDAANVLAEMDRHVRGEAPNFQCEFRIRTKDGGWRWVLSRGMICSRATDGQATRMIGTHADITSRKVAEVAMSRANAKLHSQLDEIRILQAKLAEQAVRDPLTSLYNRRYLDETLDREVARARREGHPLSVVMLDVDHFKMLNDSYGHPAGDEVLKALAKLLQTETRAEDVVSRWGGEEFLVLLPSMPLEKAQERAEYWRSRLEQHTFNFGNFSLSVTASFGVSGYPHHGKTPDELTRAADASLYRAKHNGRNRVEMFEEDPIVFVTGSPLGGHFAGSGNAD